MKQQRDEPTTITKVQKFGADLEDAPVPSARTKKMKKKKKKKNALVNREELLIGGSEAIARR